MSSVIPTLYELFNEEYDDDCVCSEWSLEDDDFGDLTPADRQIQDAFAEAVEFDVIKAIRAVEPSALCRCKAMQEDRRHLPLRFREHFDSDIEFSEPTPAVASSPVSPLDNVEEGAPALQMVYTRRKAKQDSTESTQPTKKVKADDTKGKASAEPKAGGSKGGITTKTTVQAIATGNRKLSYTNVVKGRRCQRWERGDCKKEDCMYEHSCYKCGDQQHVSKDHDKAVAAPPRKARKTRKTVA